MEALSGSFDLISIAKRLKARREELRYMTARLFAEANNLSYASYSAAERGTPVSDAMLSSIATAMSVRYEWLKFGTGEMLLPGNELNPTFARRGKLKVTPNSGSKSLAGIDSVSDLTKEYDRVCARVKLLESELASLNRDREVIRTKLKTLLNL